MKAKLSELKEQHCAARTDKQRDEIRRQIKALADQDPAACAAAALELIQETNDRIKKLAARLK